FQAEDGIRGFHVTGVQTCALPIFLNDAEALEELIQHDRALLGHRTTMVSAFTPLVGASLLHVAAEYGNADVARVLIEMGADVNRSEERRVGKEGRARWVMYESQNR